METRRLRYSLSCTPVVVVDRPGDGRKKLRRSLLEHKVNLSDGSFILAGEVADMNSDAIIRAAARGSRQELMRCVNCHVIDWLVGRMKPSLSTPPLTLQDGDPGNKLESLVSLLSSLECVGTFLDVSGVRIRTTAGCEEFVVPVKSLSLDSVAGSEEMATLQRWAREVLHCEFYNEPVLAVHGLSVSKLEGLAFTRTLVRGEHGKDGRYGVFGFQVDGVEGGTGLGAWWYSYPESRRSMELDRLESSSGASCGSDVQQLDDRKWQCVISFTSSVHRGLRMSKTWGRQIVCHEKGIRVLAAIFRCHVGEVNPRDFYRRPASFEQRGFRVPFSALESSLPPLTSAGWKKGKLALPRHADGRAPVFRVARGSVGRILNPGASTCLGV